MSIMVQWFNGSMVQWFDGGGAPRTMTTAHRLSDREKIIFLIDGRGVLFCLDARGLTTAQGSTKTIS
jgi:hypothetical protein